MKGSFFQSRRESNFYNYLKDEKQTNYAKDWIARLNTKLLIPFIKITGGTKYNREVFYEIDIDRLLKVEEENNRLREALEFYANEDNYCADVHFNGLDEPVYWKSIAENDGGEKARKALEGDANATM